MNIPNNSLSTNATVQAFNTYYSRPLELDANTYSAMVGFFTARDFEKTAAENIAVIIIQQSKLDNLNPMKILDSMRSLGSAEISDLVSEIVNVSRFKTSFLGYALNFTPNPNVFRNIESPLWKVLPEDTLLNETGSPVYTETKFIIEGD
jgi:hypothetical protein